MCCGRKKTAPASATFAPVATAVPTANPTRVIVQVDCGDDPECASYVFIGSDMITYPLVTSSQSVLATDVVMWIGLGFTFIFSLESDRDYVQGLL